MIDREYNHVVLPDHTNISPLRFYKIFRTWRIVQVAREITKFYYHHVSDEESSLCVELLLIRNKTKMSMLGRQR